MRVILDGIYTILAIAAIAIVVYAAIYYKADETVAFGTHSPETVMKSEFTVLAPENYDTAFIFYPGAKVEYLAYFPLLEKLKDSGIACVIAKMPLNLAILDNTAAERAIELLPDVKNWYIGGHSLGGAMASGFYAEHSDELSGLVLLGSYIYGEVSPEDALIVVGSNDMVVDMAKIDFDDYVDNIILIPGGNHAQFGNYGKQSGDGEAEISADVQQELTVRAILDFVAKRGQ